MSIQDNKTANFSIMSIGHVSNHNDTNKNDFKSLLFIPIKSFGI